MIYIHIYIIARDRTFKKYGLFENIGESDNCLQHICSQLSIHNMIKHIVQYLVIGLCKSCVDGEQVTSHPSSFSLSSSSPRCHRCPVTVGFAVLFEIQHLVTSLNKLWCLTMPLVPEQQIASQVARLSLAKFSHTTTSIDHSGPLSWIHVNGRGDLVCLLDKFSGSPSTPSRLILRVLNIHGILVCYPPIACQ